MFSVAIGCEESMEELRVNVAVEDVRDAACGITSYCIRLDLSVPRLFKLRFPLTA